MFYPVGDAKSQGVSVKTNPFFICGENLPHTLPHRFDKILIIPIYMLPDNDLLFI